jgi:hypothetical protein
VAALADTLRALDFTVEEGPGGRLDVLVHDVH